MELTGNLLTCLIIFSLAALLKLLWRRQPRKVWNLQPPGPPGWPILGNFFDLGTVPHQALHKLNPKYGPVLGLKLGSVNTVVIQSAMAASELFKNHDRDFCDRKCPIALTAHDYSRGTLALGRYGESWRMLRRICSMELFTNRRTEETSHLRRKCIDNMVQCIEEDTAMARERGEEGKVNLAHYLLLMSFNIVGNLVLSRDLLSSKSKEGKEFFDAMDNMMIWVGKPNLADFLPVLKWLDPLGIKRNTALYMGRARKIVSGFVNQRVDELKVAKEKTTNDFLDVLLENANQGKEGPATISSQNIITIVLVNMHLNTPEHLLLGHERVGYRHVSNTGMFTEMFLAGTETTSGTIEWAMAELLRNPESMRKVKEELDRVIGPKRKVEESDMDNLPYLQAVIKETVRLHPVIPLLLPRNAMQDTHYLGYFIPKETQIFINAYAIGRDPESWEGPLEFKPERFLGSKIDYKGHNFELIPFGAGRRICVGMPLAHKVLHLALASLLHSFDWGIGNNVCPEAIDMNERVGITMRKLIPLEAIPKKRAMYAS